MSTGSPALDKRAIELGCCPDCLNSRPEIVMQEHPKCYAAVMAAYDERYGDVPSDRVRLVMINDGLRAY